MTKILLLISLIFSFHSVAEVCEDDKLSEKNCIPEDVDFRDIGNSLKSVKKAKDLCGDCKNLVVEKIMTSPEGKRERDLEHRALLGKATLDEFQKELSFISLDLMSIRSSFALDFDPKDSIKSCDFQKNLKKPSCLSKEQEAAFNQQATEIKRSLATELANILSPTPDMKSGLLARTPNDCSFKDSDSLSARMRFSEFSMTPEFIGKLKDLNIPSSSSMEQFLKENKVPEELARSIKDLTLHPLMKNLFSDTNKLNQFLGEFSFNSKTHTLKETNDEIIEKLYGKKYAKDFGESIKNRCKDVFEKTNKYLDQIYCQASPSYVASDAVSMEAVNGHKFKAGSQKEVEKSLKQLCSHLNNSGPDALNFKVIRADICTSGPETLINNPLKEFKTEAYKSYFWNSQDAMCAAKKQGECTEASIDPGCKMLNYLNLAKSSPEYQRMAQTSGENINLILRSMVGNGVPYKGGKVDEEALVLLKQEGILEGGPKPTGPRQANAESFHKAVKNSEGEAKVAAPEVSAPKSFPETSEQERQDDTANSEDMNAKGATRSRVSKAKSSALSKQEMDDVFNRLGKASKKELKGKGNNSDENTDEEDAPESNPKNNNVSLNTGIKKAEADNTFVKTTSPKFPTNSEHKATIDPKVVRKDASYNEAKIQAQVRAPAGANLENTTMTMSKKSGQDEIVIKVPDESVLLKNTPELEAKIREYLDKSGENLSGAKAGAPFTVRLGKYDIEITLDYRGHYVARCTNKALYPDLHPEYLALLSKYFTGIKNRVSGLDSIGKIISSEGHKNN